MEISSATIGDRSIATYPAIRREYTSSMARNMAGWRIGQALREHLWNFARIIDMTGVLTAGSWG